jgi:acyl-coenzyme A synthetase/AMP-(fatty) acid ligase/acyl carrier protein
MRERFQLGPEDRFSLLSGIAHDPLHRDLFTPLQLGAAIVIPEPEGMTRPGALARWMAETGVTVAHLTPALGQLLTEGTAEAGITVPSLRWVLLVGDVLTRRDAARLRRLAPNVTVVNLYGSTETQRAVGYHVDDPAVAGAAVLPLGHGMPDVQLLVLADGGQRRAGIGEVGEIGVRSPHVALGYWKDPALTRERFGIRDGVPMYRTGDLGRYRPDGAVTFAGRADQQVKIRGFRVELGEIEAALGHHPAVREAVVLLKEGKLVAYFTSEGTVPDAAALRTFLWQRLPRHLAPQAYLALERLPLTPNGKVDRRALPEPPVVVPSSASPETELERAIAEAWCAVLGVEGVGREDNFFDLGGHSLLLVELHGKLEAALERKLPMVDLFSYPTVAALAGHLSGDTGAVGGESEAAEREELARVDEAARRQIEAQERRKQRGARARVVFDD